MQAGSIEADSRKAKRWGFRWQLMRPGATKAAKIDPKSSQNRFKVDPKLILGARGAPGWIQMRLGKQPGRDQDGQGRARDAPRALSGRPGVLQDSPRTLQERSWDAPEVTQDAS